MRGFTTAIALAVAFLAVALFAWPAAANAQCANGVCLQQQFAPVVQYQQQLAAVQYVAPVVQRQVVQYAPLQLHQRQVVQRQVVRQKVVQPVVVQKQVAFVQQHHRAAAITQRRGLFGRRVTRIVQ